MGWFEKPKLTPPSPDVALSMLKENVHLTSFDQEDYEHSLVAFYAKCKRDRALRESIAEAIQTLLAQDTLSSVMRGRLKDALGLFASARM